ncbi:hypothetical protein MP228_002864 [Amoeboaphelidium protococcarum]|nr:hypothetical protein MP228_002864 [Amoeboaphelidium protococcarum]
MGINESESRMMMLLLTMATLVIQNVHAFYLPGIAPHNYQLKDDVPLYVNALESVKTTLPYDYYLNRFHFCQPSGGPQAQGESLGSVLMGDRLFNSPFNITFGVNKECAVLCSTTVPKGDAVFINDRIGEEYFHQWEIDGLPIAMSYNDTKTGEEFYQIGFPLGQEMDDSDQVVLFNHFSLTVNYHKDVSGYFRIVGFLIYPESIDYKDSEGNCDASANSDNMRLSTEKDNKVTYTYSVQFVETNDEWRTRWDKYLHVYDPKIHWFNIINSIVIVLFLTGMIAMILLRALHKDIAKYNQLDPEEAHEETGWKLVHGDVFRSPPKFIFLSVLLGSGAQLWLMGGVTMFFAALGFLSPSNRGSMANTMIVTYLLSSSWAGYMSARLYKSFGGEDWKRNVVYTSVMVPAAIFIVFVILNFFLLGAGSSSAVPAGSLFLLMFLWFLVSIPLCFAGSYFGFKKPKIENPVRTNQIPRQVPEQVFYLRPLPSIMMGGILPFGAIFIELYFIMNSLWAHKVYYMFGFLFIVGLVLVLTCAEVTILMCYFHLVAEDYRWQWRSFFTSGACAIYVFLYSIIYFHEIGGSQNVNSAALYFGWSLVMSALMFLTTGFIGYYACWMFVRKIYGSIKVD